MRFDRKARLRLWGVALIPQLFFFYENLIPFPWGQIKVSGLACTCPDETVVNGQSYLRFITPDSLKSYNIDYSEIYVTETPYTSIDPMETNEYIIKGKVIGKRRIESNGAWNLIVEVDSWREFNFLDLIKDWCINVFFWIQVVVLVGNIYRF